MIACNLNLINSEIYPLPLMNVAVQNRVFIIEVAVKGRGGRKCFYVPKGCFQRLWVVSGNHKCRLPVTDIGLIICNPGLYACMVATANYI